MGVGLSMQRALRNASHAAINKETLLTTCIDNIVVYCTRLKNNSFVNFSAIWYKHNSCKEQWFKKGLKTSLFSGIHNLLTTLFNLGFRL